MDLKETETWGCWVELEWEEATDKTEILGQGTLKEAIGEKGIFNSRRL